MATPVTLPFWCVGIFYMEFEPGFPPPYGELPPSSGEGAFERKKREADRDDASDRDRKKNKKKHERPGASKEPIAREGAKELPLHLSRDKDPLGTSNEEVPL